MQRIAVALEKSCELALQHNSQLQVVVSVLETISERS
jgi:hypothetical protein